MLSKKKKIIILAGMLVLLIVTGVLNVILNQSAKNNNPTPVAAGNFFETFRSDRLETRNQTITYLDAIINNPVSSQEDISAAQAEKLKIATAMEQELIIEGLIKAQGFEDCVVTIGNKVNVIVKAESLTEDELIQILYIVTEETGRHPSEVEVIPIS
ncbi:MAG TPA: SpoIIIAH-like family protein [Clostridia bacterium]